MDEFWKHSKWMKPDIEGNLLQDSIYIKYNVGKSTKIESRLVVGKGMIANGYKVSLWMTKIL